MSHSIEYIAPYHYVRLINGPTVDYKPAVAGFNGTPNQSIPRINIMTIDFIKKFIPQDREVNLLANGEKILITSYDHPAPTACDCFSLLIRGEVDCSLSMYTWLENLAKKNSYKIYLDSDMEDFHVEGYDKGTTSGTGSPNYPLDDEALTNIENMMES